MTARVADGGDFIARACFPKPLVDQAVQIKYLEDGKPMVYKQRWFVLVAFCLGYFTWNFHAYRTTPLVTEFALYYNQPNELQAPPDLGIDFLLIADSIFLLAFYPLGGYLVDKYGTQMLIWGMIGQALSCWWWYLSFESFFSVVLSKILANLAGPCIGASLLRISNNWFGEDQRALAVAIGALSVSFGGGAVLIIAPLFSTDSSRINLDIISCREEDLSGINVSQAILNEECPDIAQESFCCAAPTNIDGLNLFLAFWSTAIAVYAVIVVKDAPPTPPSKSGKVRKGPSFKKALQLMFSKWNYIQICLTDFVSSGPPLVLYSTVDRIFPATVSDYSALAAAMAFIIAIPVGGYFSIKLAQNKMFYEMTAAGYVTGFVAWMLVTIFVFIGSDFADVMVLITGVIAIICYVLWTVSVYELKMEYIFSPDYAIQGYVVAMDRTIINLSNLIFLAAIPPERYTGDLMSGREFTFVVGAVFMFIGTVLVLTIKGKRDYRRMAYEEEHGETVAELFNESHIYSKPSEGQLKSLMESKASQINSKHGKSVIRSILYSTKKDEDEKEGNIAHYAL